MAAVCAVPVQLYVPSNLFLAAGTVENILISFVLRAKPKYWTNPRMKPWLWIHNAVCHLTKPPTAALSSPFTNHKQKRIFLYCTSGNLDAPTLKSVNLGLFRTTPIPREWQKWTNRREAIGRTVGSFGQIRPNSAAAPLCAPNIRLCSGLHFSIFQFSISRFVCLET